MTFAVSCCSVSYDTEKFYVNEKFILVNQSVAEKVLNCNTCNVRTWEIQRIVVDNDSIMIGKIDDSGCGCGILTDEKWKEKMVGDTLYFEYINKARFVMHKIAPYRVAPVITGESHTSANIPLTEPLVINLNDLETERKILEIERQILS